ncbi:MAG: hypothetical protein L6Q33_00475 [Bacteriovoracaceae bacterium]|nr:hypothetical protein [Bacteriovoracaceae bacterium]
MTYLYKKFRPQKNLKSIKVWLSGAIPENEYWPHPLIDQDILEFVSYFSAMIFAKGGTIIHGSHPLFTPIVAEQAKNFAQNKSQLKLYVSAMWGQGDIKKHDAYSTIIEIPSYQNSKDHNDPIARNNSLRNLREKMIYDANCILSIGGKLHPNTQIKPGVPEELTIAEKHRIPSYVIGGFGGASEAAGQKNFINPFLSEKEKSKILNANSISFLPSTVVGLLERDRIKISLYRTMNKILGK